MADEYKLADHSAEVAVSAPELLAKGFLPYQRYRVRLKGPDVTVLQTRDVLLAGRVVAVLPVDLARGEVLLIRQFRLPAHLADDCGDMVETVAGRAEAGESLEQTARRECQEEIGVVPAKLIELFSFMTTPGITDEMVTVFLTAIDAERVPARSGAASEGEQIETIRVSIDAALGALAHGTVCNGLLVIALQWLALNRARLAELLR